MFRLVRVFLSAFMVFGILAFPVFGADKTAEEWVKEGAKFSQEKKNTEAKNCYFEALKLDSKNKVALNNLALIYYDENDYPNSLKYFNDLLLISPKDLQALSFKGEILGNTQKFAEAIETLDMAMKEYPKESQPVYFKALVLFRQKEFEKALPFFTKALELVPNSSGFMADKADCLANLGKYDEAIALFDEALRMAPNDKVMNSSYWLRKGKVFEMKKSNLNAQECYKTALQLEPGNGVAKEKLEGLKRK